MPIVKNLLTGNREGGPRVVFALKLACNRISHAV